MSQREAFEAHIERTTGERPFMVNGTYNNVVWRKSWADWQAAIQHARDVAVKICNGEMVEEVGPTDHCYNNACAHCADAIKEALK